MPFGSEGVGEQIGIALSGGGFRATLFHIGSLWRLNELAILEKVGRISSVSGGSITSGRLAAQWKQLRFKDGIAQNYRELVAEPLRAFCRLPIDVKAIGQGALLPWKNASSEIARAYTEHLFDVSLKDLPEVSPRFIFNATNLQTGRSFRFSKPYMGDYRLGLIREPDVALAIAVAASSAFPPFLSPVILEDAGNFEKVPGADLNGRPEYTRRLFLSDGGVYDNLGLETVWNRCSTILVSDAGAPFSVGETVDTDLIRQTSRALDVATDQSRSLRKRAMIEDFQRGERQGAYWGIDTKIGDYKIADALPCKDKIVSQLAGIRTRLNPFSDAEQELLINWGYALCDAAVRKYAPHLLASKFAEPLWPCPDHSLNQA